MTINKNLVGLGDWELHRPFHGGIFAIEVIILLKFDVNLPEILMVPQVSKYDRNSLSLKV